MSIAASTSQVLAQQIALEIERFEAKVTRTQRLSETFVQN
jgi:hypothetical protein